ncbi:MAG: restriction endonuclease [Firmicutes bacterium]|nr:restriction endonuclease [Bacillota bacterium]
MKRKTTREELDRFPNLTEYGYTPERVDTEAARIQLFDRLLFGALLAIFLGTAGAALYFVVYRGMDSLWVLAVPPLPAIVGCVVLTRRLSMTNAALVNKAHTVRIKRGFYVEKPQNRPAADAPAVTPAEELARRLNGMTGTEFEDYFAGLLVRAGYTGVHKTRAGSDYGADIVATGRRGERICFQCKRYRGAVPIAAVQEIIGARAYYACDSAAVATNSGFTRAARRLAAVNRVKLYDGGAIAELESGPITNDK